VIGGSAGGIDALLSIVPKLPADLGAAVFVVIHSSGEDNQIPTVLSRRGRLRAVHATDGEVFQPGNIYVARPDHHLLLEGDHVRLMHGPKENRHRPAIDPLFRSAAMEHGERVIGVILSGALGDGTHGMVAVQDRGGIAVVQDPADAVIASMPRSVLSEVDAEHVLPASDIGALLVHLSAGRAVLEADAGSRPAAPPARPAPPSKGDGGAGASDDGAGDYGNGAGDEGDDDDGNGAGDEGDSDDGNGAGDGGDGRGDDERGGTGHFGHPEHDFDHVSRNFACPECGGILTNDGAPGVPRFICRTGHSFSADSLLQGQAEGIEAALWAALRTLEERCDLANRMARSARERGHTLSEQHFERVVAESTERARLIRAALHGLGLTIEPPA